MGSGKVWGNSADILCVFLFQEFAGSLQNSGIHGAVMVLDPSFNTDSMATALGISAGKHMVRQHLSEEMNALLAAARWKRGRDVFLSTIKIAWMHNKYDATRIWQSKYSHLPSSPKQLAQA